MKLKSNVFLFHLFPKTKYLNTLYVLHYILNILYVLSWRPMQNCVVDLLYHTSALSNCWSPKFDISQRQNVCWSSASSFGHTGHTCGVTDWCVEAEQPKLFSQLIS